MSSPIFGKIYANLFENDKFRGIPPEAGWEWVKLLLYCVRNETDGFISLIGARDLLKEDSLTELLSRGLLDHALLNTDTSEIQFLSESEWNPNGTNFNSSSRDREDSKKNKFKDGFVMHDYTDWQTSKAYINAKRKADRDRKAKPKAFGGSKNLEGWSDNAE